MDEINKKKYTFATATGFMAIVIISYFIANAFRYTYEYDFSNGVLVYWEVVNDHFTDLFILCIIQLTIILSLLVYLIYNKRERGIGPVERKTYLIISLLIMSIIIFSASFIMGALRLLKHNRLVAGTETVSINMSSMSGMSNTGPASGFISFGIFVTMFSPIVILIMAVLMESKEKKRVMKGVNELKEKPDVYNIEEMSRELNIKPRLMKMYLKELIKKEKIPNPYGDDLSPLAKGPLPPKQKNVLCYLVMPAIAIIFLLLINQGFNPIYDEPEHYDAENWRIDNPNGTHPDWILKDIEEGDAVVLFFWSDSCLSCDVQWNDMKAEGLVSGNKTSATWEGPSDVVFHSIHAGNYTHKNETGKTYFIYGLPTTIFIYKDGNEIKWYENIGYMKTDDIDYIIQEIQRPSITRFVLENAKLVIPITVICLTAGIYYIKGKRKGTLSPEETEPEDATEETTDREQN